MHLTNIHLEGYRSFASLDLMIPEGKRVVCLVGKNGLGKTNFLEALYLLSLSRPFRGKKFEEIVGEGSEVVQVMAVFDGERPMRASLFAQAKPFQKQFVLNDKKSSSTEMVGEVPMVLFHPGDISSFAGSPAYRRRYLNILISQTQHAYTNDLVEYATVLKHRNKLLKRIRMHEAEVRELEYWDQQAAALGVRITQARQELVEFLQFHLSTVYSDLAGEDTEVHVRYVCSSALKEGVTEECYLRGLTARVDRDVAMTQTTIGPHRDDIVITINGRDALHYASRGEMRTLILALKLLEITYINECKDVQPLLLLDDVFSELDIDRQMALLERVRDVQTLITVTHTEPLDVSAEDIMVVEVEGLRG